MKKTRGFMGNSMQRVRGLCAGGMALLLAVLIMLPVIPVYAGENIYEVQAGDCLWKIAEEYLGDGARYTDIVEWNKELIQDPDLIYPGMVLRIMADAEAETDTETETDTKTETDTETETNTGMNSNTETDMQDTLAETLEELSIIGTISGSSWENEWLGMRFDVPEGFRMEDAEQFISNHDDDADDSEDDSMMVDVEFVVESTGLSGTIAFFGLTVWDDSVEEFMEEIKPIVEKGFDDGLEADMEWGVGETAEFGGKTFDHFTVSSEIWGFGIYQDYYVTKQDDIVCFFFTIYIDGIGSDPKVLLDGFSEYADNSDDKTLQTEAQQEKADKDLILTETMRSYDGDGTMSITTVYKNEYDEAGNRIRRTKYNEDGDVTQWYVYEYDEKGNVTAEIYTVEYMDVWETHIYKEDGELLDLLQDSEDRPGNGETARTYKWEYEYDEFDSVISKLYEAPTGEQELTLYEYEYDEADNVVKETSYLTNPGDEKNKKLTEWTEYSYDGDNRVTESTTYDSEGVVQRRMTTEYTFDAAGNMTTTTRLAEDGSVLWFTTNSEDIAIDGGYQSSSEEDPDFISLYEFDERGNFSRINDYHKGNATYYTIWEYEYKTV